MQASVLGSIRMNRRTCAHLVGPLCQILVEFAIVQHIPRGKKSRILIPHRHYVSSEGHGLTEQTRLAHASLVILISKTY